jgi:hypothetical protein
VKPAEILAWALAGFLVVLVVLSFSMDGTMGAWGIGMGLGMLLVWLVIGLAAYGIYALGKQAGRQQQ